MTKAELIDAMAEYPDDAPVVIEVHDTMLSEDLYDFTFDGVSWTRFNFTKNTSEEMHELRLTAINHHETIN
jgi:hypothetical protein